MRTGLTVRNIPRLPRYAWYVLKAMFQFHRPFEVISHYMRESTPVDRTVVLRNGLSMSLSEHPHDIVTIFVVMVKKEYGTVRSGSVVVDIGANIGSFSLYAARQGARKVYSYEPNAQTHAVLARNISSNSYAEVVVASRAAVLGDDVPRAVMPKQSSPYNQIVAGGTISANEEEVPSTTLARILADNRIDAVDLMKMDCEGAEFGILFKASPEVLVRIGEIRMEYHSGDAQIDELIAYLRTEGFSVDYHSRADQILWLKRR